jgi:prefoldin subunit 5
MEDAILIQVQELHDEAVALEDRVRFIDEQLHELGQFIDTIHYLHNLPDNLLLTSLGKGVFVQSKPVENALFVDVGANVFLKRNPAKIIETIIDQQKRLREMRIESFEQLDDVQEKLALILKRYKSQ